MSDILESAHVSVAHKNGARYPTQPPFNPDVCYPEYPFGAVEISDKKNDAYFLVREGLRCLGLDAAHFGDRLWNPLQAWVRPGDTVVLKPNWALHEHVEGGDFHSVVTHSAVVRAIADYVLIALMGSGRIVIADAPLPPADFEALTKRLFVGE